MTYFRETWSDRHFGKIMIGFFLSVFFLLGVGIYSDKERSSRHIQQCMDDGKKEYECHAIVYHRGFR